MENIVGEELDIRINLSVERKKSANIKFLSEEHLSLTSKAMYPR